MPSPESGHMVMLQMVVAANAIGPFVDVGEVTSDLSHKMTSPVTNIRARGTTMPSKFVSPTVDLDAWAFTFTFKNGDPVHDAIREAFINKTTHGWRQLASSGAFILCSGAVATYERKSPHEEGVVTVDITVEQSGPIIIDGTMVI